MAKGPFMEYLRATAIQASPNAFGETQMPTPTSKTENMAMLIHSIEMMLLRYVDTTPTDTDTVSCHVSSQSQTSIRKIDEPETLASFLAVTHINAVYHDTEKHGQLNLKFDPPILYPKANLYLAISSSGHTTGQYVKCRIGYTLEKVSREDFISALVE
ncbi:hypothetical protein ES705_43372 [subsurface metagenome]